MINRKIFQKYQRSRAVLVIILLMLIFFSKPDGLVKAATGDVVAIPCDGKVEISFPDPGNGIYTWEVTRFPDGQTVIFANSIPGLTYFGLTNGVTYTFVIKQFGTGLFIGQSDPVTLQPGLCSASQPPVANAGGPYSVGEGGNISLNGLGSSDPDGDPIIYAWDFDGDGQYDDATGPTPNFSALGLDGPSVVSIGLQVTDDNGLTGIDTAIISIVNLNPTINTVSNSGPIIVGESATITATANDPAGINDPLSYSFDCNVITQSTNSATCSFDTVGNISVEVTVNDGDGGTTAASTTIIVLNPVQGMERLVARLEAIKAEGHLNDGQANALTSKLNNAIEKLAQQKTETAINKLNSFINQVNNLVEDGVLTATEGQLLIGEAEHIIDALTG